MAGDGVSRRYPIGAELCPGGVHFRLWAPKLRRMAVAIESEEAAPRFVELEREREGYFSGRVAGVGEGTLYRFRPGGQAQLYPDPASRFQPQGPHGPSQVLDPGRFRWTDRRWKGLTREAPVLYEMHVGAFTPEGTWAAAARQLPELAALGIDAIELMPVAEFPGGFGWGYDGVNLFAPYHVYGTADDFRRFVDRAHGVGIGVVLDVVYNHFGPEGNYFRLFAADYFTSRYEVEWGEAVNFDGPRSGPVREFFLTNARGWIEEFHLDGLRIDATQALNDQSPEHIIAALVRTVRAAAPGRRTLMIAENEPQNAAIIRPLEQGGCGLDTTWNDDFHHSALVALTGHSRAYFTDYRGTPQEFISCAKRGFLYQGQRYEWHDAPRGAPCLGAPPARFVNYLQNHDQVANVGRGERVHRLTSPGRLRAATALLLLGPNSPLLFQGQEFAASAPFVYFCDLRADLGKTARANRRRFLSQFPNLATAAMQAAVPDPCARESFERCKLEFAERERHGEIYALHKDLLQLRRADPAWRLAKPGGVDGAVLSESAFCLRWLGEAEETRLALFNFGRDLHLMPAPEPLLAPPPEMQWTVRWSSEAPRYGGLGTPAIYSEAEGWRVPGEAAVLLAPAPFTGRHRKPR